MIRILSVVAAPLVAIALAPASAHAQSFVLVDVVDSGSTTGPRVSAACKLEAPILQTNGIQFVISGSATASNTAVTPLPLATHVHCVLRTDHGAYGGPSGDAPGPVAVAAGTSHTVPFDRLGGVRVCAYGVAFFQGGGTTSSIPSPGC